MRPAYVDTSERLILVAKEQVTLHVHMGQNAVWLVFVRAVSLPCCGALSAQLADTCS